VIEAGEPTWLPEDRDILETWFEFEKDRHQRCGRWAWEHDNLEGFVLDYDVCPFCSETSRFADDLAERRDDMHGVYVGYYPTVRQEE
jgi:hypothetical protein